VPAQVRKSFRGDILAGDLAQIRIDYFRADRVLIAVVVEILKQLVARQVATAFDDARESAIVDIALVAISAFAAEAEMNVAALNARMAIAQCRQPEALVLLGVFVVADAEQSQLHHAYNGSQHALARQPRSFQIFLDTRADQRQHARESKQLAVLGVVAYFAPARMIPILFASTLIATRRLQMPIRIAADLHLFPRRGYRQCADAFQRRDVAHQRAIRQTIIEPVARVAARNPRHRIIDVTQLCALRGDSRIVCCFERCNGIDFPLFYVIGFA
jgi:hypothetical protein